MNTPAARIAEIRERMAAATPGPWALYRAPEEPSEGWPVAQFRGWTVMSPPMHCDSLGSQHADAALIANAPDDLRFLLGELDKARGLLARVLDSEVVKSTPFAGYSEALADAHAFVSGASLAAPSAPPQGCPL